jgi:hypothetical protein
VNLFRFVPGYESAIYEPGKEPLFFLFLAFLIAFALTRVYTHVGRARGWGSGTVGGVHLHHAVPGIVLLVLGGVIAFVSFVGWVAAIRLAKPTSPWARWLYDPAAGPRPEGRARKLARSERRFERSRFERFHRWFVQLVGGKAEAPSAGR